jgi:dihydroxy-acid dehydratase
MGIPSSDMEKPKIAVVNSSSNLSVCFRHLDDVAAQVKRAIIEAGGLPFEIRTTAPSDFVTSAGKEGRYLMPARELIVNDIEAVVEGAVLDGMICLASCDKTTPAHLMAAARLDVPSIVVICGYQASGSHQGGVVDIDDVYESVGSVAAGQMSVDELGAMADQAIVGPGVCAGLGTANTMHVLCEALGMALPGSAPVRAASPRMDEMARESGRRIVQLIDEGVRPRSILTEAALENAIVVDIALGGSINSIRHLQAIAVEGGLALDIFRMLERRSAQIPLLCAVRPNGPHRTEDLERAGGALALMKQLETVLRHDALTVAGVRLGEVLEGAEVHDEEVIHPLSAPLSPHPGLCLVRGTLAPGGALVKLAAVPPERMTFVGPAKVFASEADAIAGIGSGLVARGDVIVLRGLGPKGGPGTVFAAGFVAALNGAAMASEVAVVTDGELSGLNRGLTIGQVMPEAAEGGPLAFVQEGDSIRIDLDARTIDLEVSSTELARRRVGWEPLEHTEAGWLGQYAALVQSLTEGAVLGARRSGASARPRADV